MKYRTFYSGQLDKLSTVELRYEKYTTFASKTRKGVVPAYYVVSPTNNNNNSQQPIQFQKGAKVNSNDPPGPGPLVVLPMQCIN